jgi:hypothetical protein
MWVEFLLWGIAGGLFLELWQVLARILFERRGPGSINTTHELIAVLLRLAIAGAAGWAVHIPLDDPSPVASALGGALAPLFVQDVVRRTSLRTANPPEGQQGIPPPEEPGGDQGEGAAGATSPLKDPPTEDGDGQTLTPPRGEEEQPSVSAPPDGEGGGER